MIPTPKFLKEHILPILGRREKIRWALKMEILAKMLRESADYKEEV